MTMKAEIGPTSSSSTGQKLSTRSRDVPPGSPLAMICMDQNEFELDVGHAMDVLRDDYPCILTDNPGKKMGRSFYIRNENPAILTLA
jgi:hypothetical protein